MKQFLNIKFTERRNASDAVVSSTELKHLITNWPYVMRQVTDDWARRFAYDIWEKAANPYWCPTLKQAHVMQKMVRELARACTDETVILIE